MLRESRYVFRVGSKGQAYDAMKFLQGAVIAVVLLGIVYGGLQFVKQYSPGDDVLSISADLLSSAYSAAGTGYSFSRIAKLKPTAISGKSIKYAAGIDNPELDVELCCDQPVAKTDDGQVCNVHSCYKSLYLQKGTTIPVCVVCDSINICKVYLGSSKC